MACQPLSHSGRESWRPPTAPRAARPRRLRSAHLTELQGVASGGAPPAPAASAETFAVGSGNHAANKQAAAEAVAAEAASLSAAMDTIARTRKRLVYRVILEANGGDIDLSLVDGFPVVVGQVGSVVGGHTVRQAVALPAVCGHRTTPYG